MPTLRLLHWRLDELTYIRQRRMINGMYTFVETKLFTAQAQYLLPEDERSDFFAWLSANPQAGDVVPGTGGLRKVRWSRPGMGKRGGVRVIHFNRLENGVIHLLVIYAKSVRGNIPASTLKAIKQELENDGA